MRIQAKCIKETYTWEGDGKEHKFPYVKLGLVYTFDVDHEGVRWLDKDCLPNKQDYGFIDYTRRGLTEKYFKQMFETIVVLF